MMERFRAHMMYLIAAIACNLVSGQQAAYMAAFSANLFPRPAANPQHFDVTTINRGNNLNESTYRVTVPRDDVYLGMLTVGTLQGQVVDYLLYEFSNMSFSCHRGAQSQDGHNTYSRDVLIWHRTNTLLHTQSIYGTYSGPTGLLTSWGTASLPASESNVAFTVARTTSFSAGKMSFQRVFFNIGNGWQASNNRFVAPRSGTYFFSFSLTANSGAKTHFKLMINNEERLNIYRMSTSHNLDPTSRSALLPLTGGDRVELVTDYPGWSNANNVTTFSGFLYQPIESQRYAWGAYRTSSWIPDDDKVPYDLVLVNDGSVWEENHVNCPISGVYYVYISAGLMTNTPGELTIMRNAEPMGKLLRDDLSHNGIDTFGRSMLIECSAGDLLWVSAAPGTELYSDFNLQTSFCGFYLNP